jgi:hypothetical protein
MHLSGTPNTGWIECRAAVVHKKIDAMADQAASGDR